MEHAIPETHDSEPFVWHRGPLIVSCESLFWHWQRYPRRRVAPHRPPLSETARPRELEQPYRQGHGRVFRLPLTRRALVVGYWEPAGRAVLADEESEKLTEAIEGAHIPGITAVDIAEWARARDWSRLQLLLRRVRALLGLEEPPTPVREAVATSERPESADGWVVVPLDDVLIDMEDARVRRAQS